MQKISNFFIGLIFFFNDFKVVFFFTLILCLSLIPGQRIARSFERRYRAERKLGQRIPELVQSGELRHERGRQRRGSRHGNHQTGGGKHRSRLLDKAAEASLRAAAGGHSEDARKRKTCQKTGRN